jgi:hypothetical protein
MRKRDELTDPRSCLNKARDDERLFVLLERDDAFVATVRYWIEKRIELGKNQRNDAKLTEAEELCRAVLAEQGG